MSTSQCLVCLKWSESCSELSDPLRNADEVAIERQLSVIYLVNKLLEIPSEVCSNYLTSFGNPEEWFSICADCSSLVGEGRRLFSQIQQLIQRHKKIGQEIRLKMKIKAEAEEIDDGQVILGQAGNEIRHYLDILDYSPVGIDHEDDESLNFDNLEMDKISENTNKTKISNKKRKIEQSNLESNEFDPLGEDFDTSKKTASKRKMKSSNSRPKRTAAKNRSYVQEYSDEEEIKVEHEYEQNDQDFEIDPLGECSNDFDLNNEDEEDSSTLRIDPFKFGSRKQSLPNGGQCEECQFQTNDSKSWENHFRSQHMDQEALKCGGCSITYQLTNKYSEHYHQKLISDPNSPCVTSALKCSMNRCTKTVRCSQTALDLHQKLHNVVFSCDHCPSQFTHKFELSQHLKDAHGYKDVPRCLKCPKPGCSWSFSHKCYLQKHLDGFHGSKEGAEPRWKCQFCPEAFYHETRLKRHLKSSHDFQPKKLKRKPETGETLSFEQVLAKHEELKSKLEPLPEASTACQEELEKRAKEIESCSIETLSTFHNVKKFPCQSCPLIFSLYKKWESHSNHKGLCRTKYLQKKKEAIKGVDSIILQRVPCDDCGQEFQVLKDLEDHMRKEHLDQEALKCKGCLEMFTSLGYILHYSAKLKKDPSDPCVLNGIRCEEGKCAKKNLARPSQETMAIHHKLFHAAKHLVIYKCTICQSTYADRSGVVKHISAIHNVHVHSDRRVPCPRAGCSRTFRAQYLLKNHIDGFHGARKGTEKEFKCNHPNCTAAFYFKAALQKHEKVHNPINSYVCDVCGKSFKIKNYLRMHSYQHDPILRKKIKVYQDNRAKYKRQRMEQELQRQTSNYPEDADNYEITKD